MADDTAIPAPEPITLHTSDDVVLEAELSIPADPIGAVVLAHPHPMQGGSMKSLVTSELFRNLPANGIAVLRFNFRGVGESEGEHGHGVTEHADVLAGVSRLAEATPARPLVLAGWSFGADVSLTVLDERLAGWFLIAPPLRILPREDLLAAHDPRPKFAAVPEHDPFLPPEPAREAMADWTNTTVEVVAGADHFLVGRTAKAVKLVTQFVTDLT